MQMNELCDPLTTALAECTIGSSSDRSRTKAVCTKDTRELEVLCISFHSIYYLTWADPRQISMTVPVHSWVAVAVKIALNLTYSHLKMRLPTTTSV